MTDLNLGIYTAKLDPRKCIHATSEQLRIHHHHYHGVVLGDFIQELTHRKPHSQLKDFPSPLRPQAEPLTLQPEAPVTITRLVARLDAFMDEDVIVIADIGDALFAATELTTYERTNFISPAYYTSMGYAVPASVGACFARPDARPIVIAGDGAFQMTGMELSTIVRYGFAPIVIVLDNQGYGTERFLHPGNWEYNEIHSWNYHQLPEVLGGGTGYEIFTEGEFDQALNSAWKDTSGFSLLHVHTAVDDASRTLRRLADRMGQRVRGVVED